jgi:ComF family protein
MLIKNFFNFFLQSNCPICQRTTSNELCPNCTKQLQKCQLNDTCILWKQPIPIYAWGAYNGILKRAIAVMKYENHPEIARLLGQYLGQQWLMHVPIQSQSERFVVVPIPIHPDKLKKRGFNQAEIIAQGFCDVTELQIKPNLLKRVSDTQAQHSLSVSERKKNLTGAFAVAKSQCSSKHVLIIDDIYTTGATIKEAVKVLRQAKLQVIGAAVTAIPIKQSL